MSEFKHSFSFQHIQNSQLILFILNGRGKMATMAVSDNIRTIFISMRLFTWAFLETICVKTYALEGVFENFACHFEDILGTFPIFFSFKLLWANQN